MFLHSYNKHVYFVLILILTDSELNLDFFHLYNLVHVYDLIPSNGGNIECFLPQITSLHYGLARRTGFLFCFGNGLASTTFTSTKTAKQCVSFLVDVLLTETANFHLKLNRNYYRRDAWMHFYDTQGNE